MVSKFFNTQPVDGIVVVAIFVAILVLADKKFMSLLEATIEFVWAGWLGSGGIQMHQSASKILKQ